MDKKRKKKKKSGFIKKDRTIISQKLKESLSSVLPIILIVLLLCFTVTPMDSGTFVLFIFGAFFVVFGIGLFTLGADVAMTPIGEYVGKTILKTKKIWLILPLFFIIGVMITVSEPDLQVLASQVSGMMPEMVMIIAVGIGVGLFLVIAFLRIIIRVKLKYILLGSYILVFVLAFIVPSSFVPMAFDSGGVTTGPMSVPFIIAIGTGFASIRSDGNAEDDSFGLTALCSVGPIIAVMILGVIFRDKADKVIIEPSPIHTVADSQAAIVQFLSSIPKYLKEVGIALLPIIVFFLIVKIFGEKISKQAFIRILIGILYTFVGLTIFLTGVNVGFMQVGTLIGQTLGGKSYNWIIVPIGMVIGFFVVAAEPAVSVLAEQVSNITAGALPKKALLLSLGCGVALSIGLAMLRILLHIPILYFLIPAYAIAIILTFIVPDMFSAIAFDSGGVASGAMTASFVLPLALGLCKAVGGNMLTEGFGIVAFVAMTPLIAIQILGLVYKFKAKKSATEETTKSKERKEKEEIIG